MPFILIYVYHRNLCAVYVPNLRLQRKIAGVMFYWRQAAMSISAPIREQLCGASP